MAAGGGLDLSRYRGEDTPAFLLEEETAVLTVLDDARKKLYSPTGHEYTHCFSCCGFKLTAERADEFVRVNEFAAAVGINFSPCNHCGTFEGVSVVKNPEHYRLKAIIRVFDERIGNIYSEVGRPSLFRGVSDPAFHTLESIEANNFLLSLRAEHSEAGVKSLTLHNKGGSWFLGMELQPSLVEKYSRLFGLSSPCILPMPIGPSLIPFLQTKDPIKIGKFLDFIVGRCVFYGRELQELCIRLARTLSAPEE